MTYHALIQGGAGPDGWDCWEYFEATDIVEAAKQARAKAYAMGGTVVRIEKSDT